MGGAFRVWEIDNRFQVVPCDARGDCLRDGRRHTVGDRRGLTSVDLGQPCADQRLQFVHDEKRPQCQGGALRHPLA
jgi:hypothetical protein